MKRLSILLLSMLMLLSAVIPVGADEGIKVTINGNDIAFDVPPQTINNVTMVPLRAIFESLGASVSWDEATQTITAVRDTTKIILTINGLTMTVNDKSVALEPPACVIEGAAMVPVRAIAEAFGTEVNWDAASKTVLITSSTYVPLPAVAYDDMQPTINKMKDFIGKGSYLEAIREGETALNEHTVKYEDRKTIQSLIAEARQKYSDFLENQKAENNKPKAVSYENMLPNINQIKSMIGKGLYLEAIRECNNALNWHTVSDADKKTIQDLRAEAQQKYNNYLAKQKSANNNSNTASSSVEFYEGTSLPTFTSIAGLKPFDVSYNAAKQVSIYKYKYYGGDVDRIINYAKNIVFNYGWSMGKYGRMDENGNFTDSGLSYGIFLQKDRMVLIDYEPLYSELWILIGEKFN